MPGMLAPQPFWILSLMGVLITKCNRLFQYWVALIIFIFELRCCIHSWNLNPFLVLILLCKITHMYPGETSVPSQSWLPIKTSLVLSFFKWGITELYIILLSIVWPIHSFYKYLLRTCYCQYWAWTIELLSTVDLETILVLKQLKTTLLTVTAYWCLLRLLMK